MATTLRIWRQQSHAAAHAQQRSGRLLVGWRRHRAVAHGFGWWATQVGRRAGLREGLAVLLCRRVHGALAVALAQWQHGVAASRHAKENELQRWREWAHVESYQRRCVASGVRHLLYRMRTRYLRASFEEWSTRGERNRRLDTLLALGVGEQPLDLQRAAFRDWRCGMRWKCVSGWREDPAMQRQQAAFTLAAERLCGRLSKRGLGRVLSNWRVTAREQARVALLLQNAMARWNIGSLRGAFATWKAILSHRDKEDRFSAMQRLAVAKMNFRGMMSLADCVRSWRQEVVRQRRGRQVVSNCLLRMQHSMIMSAVGGWRDAVQSSKERKVRSSRAITRMLNATMANALYGWRDAIQSRNERKIRGGRAITRMLNAIVAGAFSAWRDEVQSGKERKIRGARAITRMLNAIVTGAFSAWRDEVQSGKERKVRGGRAITRMLNAIVAGAFSAWRECVKESVTRRNVALRALKRLTNNFMFTVLDMWREHIQSAKHRRMVGVKALLRLHHGVMSAAMAGWRAGTESAKSNKLIGARAVLTLQHAVLGAALRGLREAVLRMKTHRKICRKALLRLFRVMLSSAFHGWQESVVEKRRRWSIIHRAVHRLTMRMVASAFVQWQGSTCRQKKLHQSVRNVILRLSNRILADTLVYWQQATVQQRRSKVAGERSVRRLLNRSIARSFECWWATIVELRRRRKLCTRVLVRVQHRYTCYAFDQWAENVAAALETARALTVEASVLKSVVQEYDASKTEWEQRWGEMSAELSETKRTVKTLRQQLEQTRARSTIAIKQASMGRADEVAEEQKQHEAALQAERQRSAQLADTVMALRAEMERLTSESATHAYIQTVCEDTLLQLMDGNERLRREKLALENLQEGVPAVGPGEVRVASPTSSG